MKRRLFWKILVAFWLTFLGITHGVWLLFEIGRNERPPPEGLMARVVAPVVLASGIDAVNREGPTGLESFASHLPESQRDRLTIEPVSQRPEALGQGERRISREVTAPNGQVYRLSYGYRDERPPAILRAAPPEFLIPGILGGLLFSAVLAWYLTEPIARLRAGFDRLARGDLEVRLGPSIGRRRDEIADLGRDFDMMAQRLEQLVSARDRLLHDVSHELRSPLARLQLAIGLARQNPDCTELTLDRVEREVQRLEILVDELLTLARAEGGQNSREDYFDLADVVASVAEDACFEAEASEVRIRLQGETPLENERPLMTGNAELLQRALDNVIRNALRFSSPGQAVDVRVSYSPKDKTYQVDVSDQGPGVREEDIPAMFDPFVRGEDAGGGLGLGLSIASRAIMAHGGKVTAHNREGGGLLVTMTFPVADLNGHTWNA
ncbi:MAG: HAMP domain-containing protein [Porphyrobacter sp.]|nr:HAMP domain-containing protein [Porphyrobacter sp.]